MKKVITLLIIMCVYLSLSDTKAQKADFLFKNFVQVNETEFTFDVYIQHVAESPEFLLYGYAFEIHAENLGIFPGSGDFGSAELLFDGLMASEVDAEHDLTGVNKPGYTSDLTRNNIYVGMDGRIRYNAPGYDASTGDVPATIIKEGRKYFVDRFRVKLMNEEKSAYVPFKDEYTDWGFREIQTTMFSAEFFNDNYITGPGIGSEEVRNNVSIEFGSRQMASYCFTGDGEWTDREHWNLASTDDDGLGAGDNLPGKGNNVIINGNVTIPEGEHISLLPNVDGNGGEMTVLEGEETLYRVEAIANGTNVNVQVFLTDGFTPIDNPSFVESGTEITFFTTGGPDSGSFTNWTDQFGTELGTKEQYDFVVESNDVIGTANWSSGSAKNLDNNKNNSQLNASLTIAPGGALTVDKLFNDNPAGADALIVECDVNGTGSLILNNLDVQVTVKNFIPASTAAGPVVKSPAAPAEWYWLAPPVTGHSIESFINELGNANYDLYRWGESEDTWYNYKAGIGVPSNEFAHVEFERGFGYLFAADEAVTFTYQGSIWTEDQIWDDLTRQGDEDSDYGAGWNLISNPFPSFITVDGWFSDNANVSLTAQYYNCGEGSYDTYLSGSVIPPKTAFFVQVGGPEVTKGDKAEITNGSLKIPKDNRTHHNTGEKKRNQNSYIILAASPLDGETKQRSYLRITPDATEGYDYRYDSRFRPGSAPIFHSVMNEEKLMVNAVNEITEELIIPFTFIRNEEGHNFKISLEENIGETDLYLVDLKEDIEHRLPDDGPYEFTSHDDDDPLRFELRFGKNQETNITDPEQSNQLVNAWTYNNILYIDSHEEDTQARLYDINGRQLRLFDLKFSGEHAYSLGLPAGVYLLRVVNDHRAETIRVILK